MACQSILTVLINFGLLVFGVTDYAGKLTTLHYGAITAREPRSEETQAACRMLGRRLAEWTAALFTAARISTRSTSPSRHTAGLMSPIVQPPLACGHRSSAIMPSRLFNCDSWQRNVLPHDAQALTINGGSSSIKFAVYALGDPPQQTLSGEVERIGLSDSASRHQRTRQR